MTSNFDIILKESSDNMDKVYIFGHKKPDTDSVMSAIALSYLKNKLGDETEPRVLGHINNETEYALKYFNISVPKYLNDVKLQIKNINYHKNFYLKDTDPILLGYQYMLNNNLTAIPIVNNNNTFLGLITIKDLSRYFLENSKRIYTSYDNILKVLEGTPALKKAEEFNANILDTTYESSTLAKIANIDDNSIVIMDERPSVTSYAISKRVKLIILVNNHKLSDEEMKLANDNNVSVIYTAFDSYNVVKLILFTNYIKNLVDKYNPIKFSESDYMDTVLDVNKRLKHTNYPIVNKKNKCLGLLRITDLNEKNRKKVILVDHNDKLQSVDGIEQAEIIEIVDHHNLGNLTTNKVVNFTNMAVGSTCTIVYILFKQNNVDIPKQIAGCLLSGILSDTLILKSPTATLIDKEAVKELSLIAELDYEKYGMDLLSAGTTIDNMSKEEIVYNDFKTYEESGTRFAIGQFFTTNFDEIKKDIAEYIKVLDRISEVNNYTIVALYVTDIVKDGSYIIYNTKAKEQLEMIYDVNSIKEGEFIKGCLSRKQHIVPLMLDYFEN